MSALKLITSSVKPLLRISPDNGTTCCHCNLSPKLRQLCWLIMSCDMTPLRISSSNRTTHCHCHPFSQAE
eukprot:12409488-Karenia_brevis.AAC.1